MTAASEAQTVSPNNSLVSKVNIASDKPSSSVVLSDQIAPRPIITDPDFQSMCDTIYIDIRELYEARRSIYHVPSYSEKWTVLKKQFEEALENLKEISEEEQKETCQSWFRDLMKNMDDIAHHRQINRQLDAGAYFRRCP